MITAIKKLFDRLRQRRINRQIDEFIAKQINDSKELFVQAIPEPPPDPEQGALVAQPTKESTRFYTSLNLDIEQRGERGEAWVVSDKTWNIACVKDNPEEALLAIWRAVYRHGGVFKMTVAQATADLRKAEEKKDDERAG